MAKTIDELCHEVSRQEELPTSAVTAARGMVAARA